MSVLVANNAKSFLTAPVTTGSTSLTVTLGTGIKFPSPSAPDVFYGTIISSLNPAVFEIVRVTARSTDTFTIVRAQDGTTAQAFNIGDIFALLPTRITTDGKSNIVSLPTSGGSANAQTVTNPSVPLAVSEGAVQKFLPGFTNTAAMTLAVDGFPADAVHAFGQPVQAGMVVAGVEAEVIMDGSSVWQLQNPQVPYAQLPASTGSANAQAVANPVNPFKALESGIKQRFIPSFTNTGPMTFSPDGLTPASVAFRGSTALTGGEVTVDATAELVYNGTTGNWDLINSSATPSAGFIGDAQVFIVSGTFTPTESGDYLVEGFGGGAGGGAGGGSSSPGGNSVGGSGGGGGSGGQFGAEIFTLVAGTPYTVTIGAGGAGGTSGGAGVNGNDGFDGGDTIFNGVTIAGGGKAGRGGMSLVTVNGKGFAGTNGGGAGGGEGGAGQNAANTSGNNGANGNGNSGGGGGGGGGAPSNGGTEAGGSGGNGTNGILTVTRVA